MRNVSLKPVSLKQGIQKSAWSIKDGRRIPFQLYKKKENH